MMILQILKVCSPFLCVRVHVASKNTPETCGSAVSELTRFLSVLSSLQSPGTSCDQLQRRCFTAAPVRRQPAHRARVVLSHPTHGAGKRRWWHRHRLEHQDSQLRHPGSGGQPQANAWWTGSSAHGMSVPSSVCTYPRFLPLSLFANISLSRACLWKFPALKNFFLSNWFLLPVVQIPAVKNFSLQQIPSFKNSFLSSGTLCDWYFHWRTCLCGRFFHSRTFLCNRSRHSRTFSVQQTPSFKNFRGTIEELGENKYVCSGEVAVIDDATIEITELPVRTWTQNYKEEVLEPMLQGTDKTPPMITSVGFYLFQNIVSPKFVSLRFWWILFLPDFLLTMVILFAAFGHLWIEICFLGWFLLLWKFMVILVNYVCNTNLFFLLLLQKLCMILKQNWKQL